jgi:membrane protein
MATGPSGGTQSEPQSEPHEGRRARWHRSFAGRVWQAGSELELMRRSMAFATQGLVTLVPLLIVVAAVDPFPDRGFGEWVADGMALPSNSAMPVLRLFTTQHEAAKGAGVLSLALLALFGLAFVADIQVGYEKIWGLPALPWRSTWRQAIWLGALTAYVTLEVESGLVLHHGLLDSAWRILMLGAAALVFFWWGQHFLLGGRVSWRALLPGSLATVVALGGLRLFSAEVFVPMIASNAEAYGAVGVLLVVVSWLIGVGFIFYGGALVGRCWDERRHEAGGTTEAPQHPYGPTT